MRLVVVSHKVLRRTDDGAYATDGGFPMQIAAIAELFDRTTLCVPVSREGARPGDVRLADGLSVAPLPVPRGVGVWRKLLLPVWLLQSIFVLIAEVRRADAVHAPIPGDVGTIGIVFAEVLRKKLFVRHCGNWLVQRTRAERAWKRYMERFAGGRRLMLATGGAPEPPSENPSVNWIFSTTLTEEERQRIGRERTLPVDRPPRLAIACRQVVAKGTGVVIEAMALLAHDMPMLSLLVIGDGPDRERFERLAEEVGVEQRVEFVGQVDHEGVLSLLDSADIFVFPTTSSEGFPKAVGEAMAVGLPVIATPVSVLPTLLGHGGGTIVGEASPRDVAEALRGVLGDACRYGQMSRAALVTASEFTLERWQRRIADELEASWGPTAVSTAARAEK